MPGELINKIKLNDIIVDKLDPIVHNINDEYDKNEINNVIKNHNIAILGALPGVGKTTSACNYKCNKKLFISPYNKLCQELRKKKFDAITLNMLLGYGCNNDVNMKMKAYDITPYDCIVFDEILLYTPKLLFKINKFMRKNKHIKFIATGDCDQNSPIGMEGLTNIINKEKYLSHCINILFPDQILLKQNKRLKNKKDVEKLNKLKNDIFDLDKNIMDVFTEYGFKIISKNDELKNKKNICFFNYQVDEVNKFVHNELIKKPKDLFVYNNVSYWKGLELVCKEHHRTKNSRLYVNYYYVIKSIGEKFFVINEPVEDIDITLETSLLSKFKLPYANTCHSVQGMTIDEEFTIFDCDAPHVNRNFVWTALTRASNMSNISIFKMNVYKASALEKSKRNQYFENKIKNYKEQDKKANREIDTENYIDWDWIVEIFEKQNAICNICKSSLEVVLKNGSITSNVSADRINNKICHTKKNCVLTCVQCNCAKSNK